MRQAASAGDFLRSPVGQYRAGRTWIAFASEGVAGLVLWGQPEAADVESLLPLIALRDSPLAVPMSRWVDIRRMSAPDAAAFLAFAEYLTTNADALGRLVTRAAVIHAGGMTGALAFGFSKIVPAPYPIKRFTEPHDAAQWLGLGERAGFVRELDEAQAAALGTTGLLRDLRAWLGAKLRGVSLPDAAEAVGMSARSLQRRLKEHGTSFQDEVNAARVGAAQRLLRETDAPVTVVAYEVGCASVHHFSELFRRMTGAAPSHWRRAATAR